jgi:hypothetical protein
MTEVFEGGCRCGRIRYSVAAKHLPNAYACHCRDCQTWSGSAFAMQIITSEEHFKLTGEPALFELPSADGSRTSRQRACPACFTRLFNTNTARPGYVVVRAGTLDRSNELKIVAHIWTTRKVQGIDIPAGVLVWPEGPPVAEFMAALRAGGAQ